MRNGGFGRFFLCARNTCLKAVRRGNVLRPGVSAITHETQRAKDLRDCFDCVIDAPAPDIFVPDGEKGSFFMLLKNRVRWGSFVILLEKSAKKNGCSAKRKGGSLCGGAALFYSADPFGDARGTVL